MDAYTKRAAEVALTWLLEHGYTVEQDGCILYQGMEALVDAVLIEYIEEQMGRPKKKVAEAAPAEQPAAVPTYVLESHEPIDIAKRDQLIKEWMDASKALQTAKDDEHTLRQMLVLMCFDPNKLEGTETVDIGWGYSLRAKKDLNITADKDNDKVSALLQAVAAHDAGLAQGLVRWQAEVAKKAYRTVVELSKIAPEVATALHEAITAKPGMPQLEMVPPKTDEPAQA